MTRSSLLFLPSIALAIAWMALGNTVEAAGFEAKTMRDTLSAREVERGLVLGKGWAEFALGADYKTAKGAWDSNGEPTEWDAAEWLYTTERLGIRYGITRRGELYWTARAHYVSLTNPDLGTDITYFGIGDPNFGYKFEVFRSIAPVTSVIAYADYKAPMGNESPGNFIGGPTTWSAVVLSTGTADITIGARAKRQVGPLAVSGGLAYVNRLSGLAQYIIETKYSQFQGRIKPGNMKTADVEAMVQVGPAALVSGMAVALRDDVKVGNTAKGWFPGKNLIPVEDSGGWTLDMTSGFVFNVTRGFDVVAGAQIPLRGEDLDFFPLETIHPTRGNTYSGTFEFRY